MLLNKLFKAVVTNTLKEGFRRGGVALRKGENELELDEKQVQIFENDPHMDIKVVDVIEDSLIDTAKDVALTIASARLGLPLATVIAVVEMVNAIRKDDDAKDELVNDFKEQAVEAVSTIATEKAFDVIEDVIDGLDLSSADEFLHPFISIIHAMNAQEPLTKKPAVKDLVFGFESDGKEQTLTPTAAQRDEAWEWYQANVLVAKANDATESDA